MPNSGARKGSDDLGAFTVLKKILQNVKFVTYDGVGNL